MKKLKFIIYPAVFICLALCFGNIIKAQEIRLKKAETPFTLKLADNTDDQIIEPSAVEVVDKAGKYLLVADDKSDESPLNLRIISASDGKLIKAFSLPNAPDKPKWEAMTKDGDYFYLIGSHAAKDDDSAAKLLKRSHLYRFRLKINENTSEVEIDSISEFDIKPSLKSLQIYAEKPSEKNVKIEGLAIKTDGCKKHLIFGLREPSAMVEVYSAELPLEAEITAGALINISLTPYFQFDAKTTSDQTRFKLSSIEYVAVWKGFLILTSSETTVKVNGKDKPVFHGNAAWFIGDEQIKAAQPLRFSESIKPVEVKKISEFEAAMKAEGFCLMPSADVNSIHLAVVYDNDTQDVKSAEPNNFLPGKMQFIELLRQNP